MIDNRTFYLVPQSIARCYTSDAMAPPRMVVRGGAGAQRDPRRGLGRQPRRPGRADGPRGADRRSLAHRRLRGLRRRRSSCSTPPRRSTTRSRRTRARHVFQVLDHSAIFLLIAGTYTPFALVTPARALGLDDLRHRLEPRDRRRGAQGRVRAEVAHPVDRDLHRDGLDGRDCRQAAAARRLRPARSRGWPPAASRTPAASRSTPGRRLRYSHAVWHLFVLAGSVCHYVAILRYIALPAA